MGFCLTNSLDVDGIGLVCAAAVTTGPLFELILLQPGW